jgi:glucose/arabinose dehydrogenase
LEGSIEETCKLDQTDFKLHMKYLILISLISLFACSSNDARTEGDNNPKEKPSIQLDKIQLPDGFKIEIYAENLPNARSICRSPEGTIFVGTRKKGDVYAIRDTDGDMKADQQWILASGLNMPNGVAVKDGDLYVAEVNRILKFSDIENKLDQPGEPEVVYDQYPTKSHHGWKFIAFGPDGLLYVPVGAPCNICESEDEIFGTITRIDVTQPNPEIVAKGVRNTVGFNWHPETNELWFTDNGGDWLGDDLPACELNHSPIPGEHFGYPYCHQGDYLDPKLGTGYNCDDFTPPVQKLDPHVAPLGMEFYKEGMLPSSYSNHVFIAEHGSWNRTKPIGYRITTVTLSEGKAVSYDVFADGWLQDGKAWGRPVDIEYLPDGSMLISDDMADAIYRIWYEG